MKIRNGFVTNSSSSSFVVVEVKNPLFAKIVKKYEEQLSDEYGCTRIFIEEGAYTNIYVDEGYAEVPSTLDEVFASIVTLFDYNGGFYEYEEEDPEDFWDTTDEDQNLPFVAFKNEVYENLKELKEQTQYVEFSCSDVGWQGDSDSRYYRENYDEETLQEMLEEIASNKGCAVEEVTDEDFSMYVSDMTSTSTDSYIYDKDKEVEENCHTFYVE